MPAPAADAPDAALAVIARSGASPDDPSALELIVRAERQVGRLDRARAAAAKLAPMLLDGPEKDELLAFAAG